MKRLIVRSLENFKFVSYDRIMVFYGILVKKLSSTLRICFKNNAGTSVVILNKEMNMTLKQQKFN